MIKKELLRFVAKYSWFLIKYRLFLTASDNIPTLDGATLIFTMMARYDIDFVSILWHEIKYRDFREMENLPFPCLI